MTNTLKPDLAEIQRTLGVLFEPGQVIEMRALKVKEGAWENTFSGYYTDFNVCAQDAAGLSPAAEGVYVVLNPIKPELLARRHNRCAKMGKDGKTTSDTDITRRRWLLIDVDPDRPSGISSTDEQKAYALEVIESVSACLEGAGFPEGLLGDSGNGWHKLYRVDLPANDDHLVERFLKSVAAFWDDDKVKIDTSVHNPARLSKLYGTLARKGDSIPTNPHRLSRIIDLPKTLNVVPVELLQEMASPVDQVATATNTSTGSSPSTGWDLEKWIADHNLDVNNPMPWGNGKKWIFNVCPWNSEHTNKAAYITQFPSGGIAAGCHHNGCQGKNWHALRALYEPGGGGLYPGLDLSNVGSRKTTTTADGQVIETDEVERKRIIKSAEYIQTLNKLGYEFKQNQCSDRIEVNGEPITDALEAVIFSKLRDAGYPQVNVARDAFTAHAYFNQYHPIRDYLSKLRYDGKPHIDGLASYFENADGTFRLWLRRWLIGTVRRALEPGRQNRMLVLDGPQNIGKSKFCEWLVPEQLRQKHFKSSPIYPDDKDSRLALADRWIWEVAELGSTTRRSDREALKYFISVEWMTARPAYGRYEITKPALSNFIGTVNNENGLLSDPTGNRRYMFSKITKIDWKYTALDVNNIWAEARHLYLAGENADLTQTETELATKINQTYEVEEPLEGILLQHFEIDPARRDWWTPTSVILRALDNGEPDAITHEPSKAVYRANTTIASMKLASLMTSLGCERAKKRHGSGANPQWGYMGVKDL